MKQPQTEWQELANTNDPSAALLHLIESLQISVHKLGGEMRRHFEERDLRRDELIATLMSEAFPAGDHEGHRRHHELVIKLAEEKAAFWKKMKEELVKYGLFGFLGWAVFALWAAFLSGPHK